MTDLKRCSKCHEEKPSTAEYFSRDKRKPNGITCICKKCKNKQSRIWAKENPEKVKANHQKWEYENKEYLQERRHRRYLENSKIEKEKKRDDYIKHREKYVSKNHSNYINHREKRIASTRKYRSDHPEWARSYDRIAAYKRRARKRAAGGAFTLDDLHLQLASQKGKCWHCGKKLKDKYHADHLIPLSRGGSNDARNIVIACPKCNLSKGAKLPQEWNGRLL